MAPIRTYANWNARPSNNVEQIEPYKHYYFICEGQNTERWYFEKFIDLKKEFSVSSLISIEYLEKTEENKTWSDPKKLFELAKYVRENGEIFFDPKHDKMVIVFDADIYENREESAYLNLIKEASKEDILCVTNPSFELFLLLHYENAYEELIRPNSAEILKNDWITTEGEEVRYIEYLFRKKSGLKPKKDRAISDFVKNIFVAIKQEQLLNTDISQCRGTITSNIGVVIASILNSDSDK